MPFDSERRFLITAPPSVCVPEVIGVLAAWISNQKNKIKIKRRGFPRVARVYSPLCPRDTQYQFLIKTLLSNTSKQKINCCPGCVMSIHVGWSWMCVLFYFSFVCLHVCAMPLSSRSIAGVPSSQALPGYLITVHHLCAFLLYLVR